MNTLFKCPRCGFLSFQKKPDSQTPCPSCGWKNGDPCPQASLSKKINQKLNSQRLTWVYFFIEYFLIAGLIIGFIYHFYIYYPRYGSETGPITPHPPFQRLILPPTTFEDRGAKITRVADFAAKARVIGIAWRMPTDAFNKWAPVDLAIGWGFMSDKDYINKCHIRHLPGIRAIEVTSKETFEESVAAAKTFAASSHTANIHIFPADQDIVRQLRRVRIGDIVIIQGQLVDAVFPDGSYIHSSLSRTDNSCESMWLTDIEILPQK